MKLQEKCVYVQNIAGYEDGDNDFFLEICCKLYTPTEVCLFLTLTVTKQCYADYIYIYIYIYSYFVTLFSTSIYIYIYV